jgi:hypothetical protein
MMLLRKVKPQKAKNGTIIRSITIYSGNEGEEKAQKTYSYNGDGSEIKTTTTYEYTNDTPDQEHYYKR